MNIVVDNLMVNYKEQGEGPVVLLLHGWGSSLETFNDLSNYLSGSFRVVSLDLPGFGSSQMPEGDWFVKDYAQLVANFMKKKKISHVYAVVGHSFGGRVIIKGISEGLLHSDKVVLIGSAGVKPAKTLKSGAYQAVAKIGKATTKLPGLAKFQSKLKSKLYKSVGSLDYLNAKEMQQIFLNTINEDLTADAKNITQPSLLLWGENDQETPVTDGEVLAERIANANLYILKNAGHYTHLDTPGKVKDKINEFLK